MPKSKKIRVVIVDDHKVVRKGLRAFLLASDDLELVGEGSCAEEAIQLCNRLVPDVVIMDLVMPGTSGAAATGKIRAAHPEIQVIALTSFDDETLVDEALRAGAISYLLKNVDSDELADAIRAAHKGKSTLAPEALQALIHVSKREDQVGNNLTKREREVLAHVVKGLTNREIAASLQIKPSTVVFHVSNILAKFGVTSRTEATSLALQNHVVE